MKDTLEMSSKPMKSTLLVVVTNLNFQQIVHYRENKGGGQDRPPFYHYLK